MLVNDIGTHPMQSSLVTVLIVQSSLVNEYPSPGLL